MDTQQDRAARLYQLRKKNGLSLEDVAILLGMSITGYMKIEHGKTALKLKYASLLAEYYEVPESWIMYGVGEVAQAQEERRQYGVTRKHYHSSQAR